MKVSSKLLLLILLPWTSFAQEGLDYSLTQSYWRSQSFIDSFMGTYGQKSGVDPKISSEEQQLLAEQIVPQIQSNNLQLAAQTLRVNTTSESSAALDFTLGNLYFQMQQLDRAKRAYETAIDKFPNFRNAYKNLGFVNVQRGNYEPAIKNLTKVIELGGGNSDTYGLLGFSFLNLNRYASAEAAYRQALLLDPDSRDWKQGLVRALLENGQNEQAIAMLNEIIAANPGNPQYWRVQANAFIRQDRIEDAITNLELLRRMELADGSALKLLGDLYMSKTMPDLALSSYTAALDKKSDLGPEAYLGAANVLLSQNNYDQAEQYLSAIEQAYGDQLPPDDQDQLLSLKSELFLATDRPDRAAEILREVVKRNPLDGRPNLLLARYEWEAGNIEKASTYFSDARKDPDFEERAIVEEARMMVSEKRYADAAELMREATNIAPGNENYAQYLDQILRAREVQRRRQGA